MLIVQNEFCILTGVPNILSVYTRNSAGHKSSKRAPAVVVDSTEPDEGIITCPKYIQVHIFLYTVIFSCKTKESNSNY